MKSAPRRRWFVIIIILIVASATVYGFIPKTVEVDLADVSRGPLQVAIEEEGRTALKEHFVLSAPTAGYLRRIDSKVGDEVRKGQSVVALEPLRSQPLDPRSRAEAEATVSAAQAGLDAAMEKERASLADADYIEKRLGRMTHLLTTGAIAKDQYDQSESEAKRARAAHRSAKAAVEMSRSELERTERTLQNFAPRSNKEERFDLLNVRSPISGVIVKIYRESEGAVNVGEPLMDIGNSRNLEVRVDLLSSDAVRVRRGTPVMFKRWGGSETLTGVVRILEPAGFTKISSLGVEEQRVPVIVDITSPQQMWQALGEGYRLEAHFVVWEGKEILQVPAGALFRSGKEWAVFVEEGGKARQRIVEVGQRNGLAAEIISGMKEKEKVIVHPDESVRHGTDIQPRKSR
jgi:HlyD family secretion protein